MKFKKLLLMSAVVASALLIQIQMKPQSKFGSVTATSSATPKTIPQLDLSFGVSAEANKDSCIGYCGGANIICVYCSSHPYATCVTMSYNICQ